MSTTTTLKITFTQVDAKHSAVFVDGSCKYVINNMSSRWKTNWCVGLGDRCRLLKKELSSRDACYQWILDQYFMGTDYVVEYEKLARWQVAIYYSNDED